MRHDTPDQIIGIGGAGKNIVYQLFAPSILDLESPTDLTQEDLRGWLIDEVLEPRGLSANRHQQERMDAFVLDTATGEADVDRPRVDRIGELLGEREDEHSDSVRAPSISYVNLVEDATTKARHLLSDNKVRELSGQTGISCWWLDDDMINRHDDFGGGVVRRRALSKALYWMSQINSNDPLEGIHNAVSSDSDVAMVVGLGGGTGAGTFLDIARELKRKHGFPDVTLFAILPHSDEDPDRGANAYAALSELEYLSLTEQNPFESIVLLPQQSSADQGDFDEAIIRTILSYYTLHENPKNELSIKRSGGPKSFAPFTIAAPQVLQYEGGVIKQAKERLEDFYGDREEMLAAESDLHDEVETFLETYHGDGSANVYGEYDGRGTDSRYSLSETEVTSLHNRINALEELVNLRVLPNIGCTVTDELQEDIRTAKENALDAADFDLEEASESRRKRAIVDEFPEQTGTAVNANTGEDKPEDTRLLALYRKEVDAIERRRDLLRAKNMLSELDSVLLDIDDDTTTATVATSTNVADAVGTALSEDSTLTNHTDLEADLDELAEKKKRHRNRIRDLDELATALETERDEQLDNWAASVSDDVEMLANLSDHRAELRELLDDLKTALDGAEGVAHGAKSPDDIPAEPRIEFSEEQFDRLNELLELCGLKPLHGSAVRNEVGFLWQAKREFLRDSTGGWFNRGPDTEELQRNHSQQYRGAQRSDLDMAFIPKWDERPETSGRLRTNEIDRRLKSLNDLNPVDEIASSIPSFLADRAVDPDALLTEAARTSLHDTDRLAEFELPRDDVAVPDIDDAFDDGDAEATLESLVSPDGAVFEAFHEAYLGDLEDERDEAEARKRGIDREVKWVTEATDLLEQGNRFAGLAEGVMDPSSISEVDGDDRDEGMYVTRASPDDPGELLSSDNIGETNFWSRDDSTLQDSLRSFTERIENHLLPIQDPLLAVFTPEETPDRDEYDEYSTAIALMSRAIDGSSDYGTGSKDAFDAVDAMLGDTLGEVDSTYWNWAHFGGSWDLTLTVFLGGVMLDNIDVFRQSGDGLKDKYDAELGDGPGRHMIDRHTHGIDGIDEGRADGHRLIGDGYDGAFLYRDSLLNFTAGDEDKLLVLNNLDDEDALRDELLDRYEFFGFESTTDLDDS
jgi:hypothetical protein